MTASALLSSVALLSQVSPTVQLFDKALVIGPVVSGGRTPCPVDPIAYQMTMGTFALPREDDKLTLPNGTVRTWKAVKAGEDGWIADGAFSGGYAFFSHVADKDASMVLEASGHTMVYVNGEPRAGDPYAFGYLKLPVKVRKGMNSFLFSVARGRLHARLVTPAEPFSITVDDPTLPDSIVGESKRLECSVIVSNATDKTIKGRIHCEVDGKMGEWWPAVVTPMTVRKIRFQTPVVTSVSPGKSVLKLSLSSGVGEPVVSNLEFTIDAKLPSEVHKRTFVSGIDGSVQYYAVQPGTRPGSKAMVLSLHGASVEASGQAAAYGRKSWCDIVCPTNGRPYGFDWEDWGRINALETLADAKKVYKPLSDQIYLTGHSMGGHGTYSIGVTNPDLFAAIAPCAGWISFWSYAGGADWKDPDPVESMMRRAANGSDTLKLIDNLTSLGVYIQHGDADDNVPVEQAREMRRHLSEFHHDFDWHEEPGQGHWFDTDPEPGANCQDYAPLFAFLSKHRILQGLEGRHAKFTTVNPSASSTYRFIVVGNQEVCLEPSSVDATASPDGMAIAATTKNLSSLGFNLAFLGDPKSVQVSLDGQATIALNEPKGTIWFVKTGGTWQSLPIGLGSWKRKGVSNFKSVFRSGVKLVYGGDTKSEISRWTYARARFDAETWMYRGNGSLTLIPDTEFQWTDPAHGSPEQNIVLYGNPAGNTAFNKVAAQGTFVWTGQGVTLGARRVPTSAGLVAIRPNPEGPGVVGVVGGASLVGCRATERLSLFTSGVHFADFFVLSPEMYLKGSKGVLGTGYFGDDWRYDETRASWH